jgi:hypothetical protein
MVVVRRRGICLRGVLHPQPALTLFERAVPRDMVWSKDDLQRGLG